MAWTSSKPHVAVWQATIKALWEIGETQRIEGGGNYSRDLYPARTIIEAFKSADEGDSPETAQAALDAIQGAVAKHFAYPGVQNARDAIQEEADRRAFDLALLEAPTPGLRVVGEIDGERFEWACREDSHGMYWRSIESPFKTPVSQVAILPTLKALVSCGAARVEGGGKDA